MELTRIDHSGMISDHNLELASFEKDAALLESVKSFIGSRRENYIGRIGAILNWLRAGTGSEAGTFYIFDGYALRYMYVQNDALNYDGGILNERGMNEFAANSEFITKKSVYSHSAITGKPLVVDDMKALPNKLPFYQSLASDNLTGYKIASLCTFPLNDESGNPVAVIQLANKKDEDGAFAPYGDRDIALIALFARLQREKLDSVFDECRSKSSTLPQPEPQLAKPSAKRLPSWLDGSGLVWTEGERAKESNITRRITCFMDYLSGYHDTNTIMDLILAEARDATGADAGTFYIVEEGRWLRFSYVQNDTLFAEDSAKQSYVDSRMPITEESISGYAAVNRRILNIRDVYDLPLGSRYKFNKSFDEASGYRTESVIAIPITASGERVIAVLQLINSKDDDGQVTAFSRAAELYAHLLSLHVMPQLLRAITSNRSSMKLLHMMGMHNPVEDEAHAQRVASYAAEIFVAYAAKLGLEPEEIRKQKDILRPAAMLHDIGMIALPANIANKPGRFSEPEAELMRGHCAVGADMFADAEDSIELAALDIMRHHHQRWDGGGYGASVGAPPSGSDIPLFARVVSVADAIDAMTSPRSYKKQWNFAGAMDQIKKGAGTQFDRNIVEAALQIEETLKAIYNRYKPAIPQPTDRVTVSGRIVTGSDGKSIWLV